MNFVEKQLIFVEIRQIFLELQHELIVDDQRFSLTLGRDLVLAIHLGVQPFSKSGEEKRQKT